MNRGWVYCCCALTMIQQLFSGTWIHLMFIYFGHQFDICFIIEMTGTYVELLGEFNEGRSVVPCAQCPFLLNK